jgi:hypothetical protein
MQRGLIKYTLYEKMFKIKAQTSACFMLCADLYITRPFYNKTTIWASIKECIVHSTREIVLQNNTSKFHSKIGLAYLFSKLFLNTVENLI